MTLAIEYKRRESDFLVRNKNIKRKSAKYSFEPLFREKRELWDDYLLTLFSEEKLPKSWKTIILPYKTTETPSLIQVYIDSKRFVLSSELSEIVEQIEEAKEILDYEFSWDEEGAEPTDMVTFVKVCAFVINYAQWIFNEFGIVINAPYIDIMTDGSISVHWETEKAQFLIIFNKEEDFKKGEEELAYFYAKQSENNIPFNSAIKPGAKIDKAVAVWMKENLR